MKSAAFTLSSHQMNKEDTSGSLRRPARFDQKDILQRHSSSPTPLPLQKGDRRQPPFFKIDDDIFLTIISFLEARDILVLRQVCQTLSSKSRLHSVWATAITTHIISQNLPWPTYAWPLSEIPSATLEELCLRTTRMVTRWDGGSAHRQCHFSRCLQRPWNSVTWMELLRSRWLLLQLDGTRLELWDLERPFGGSPADFFDGLEDTIDGFKALLKGNDHHTVLLSTRSFKTFYINTSLPHIGEISETQKRFGTGHYVHGCSGLLDADDEVAAFSRSYCKQGTIIQGRRSRAIAILRNGQGDPKLDCAAAVQIRSDIVVVARIQGVDIYSVNTVNDCLRSSGRPSTIGPFQSIPYPEGCSGLRASFLDPSCGDWAKLAYRGPDGIYLGVDTNQTPSRTLQVIYPLHSHDTPPTFQLSPSVGLLNAPTDSPAYPTILSSWGGSARRMVYLNETRDGLMLLGLFVPLGYETETDFASLYHRCVAWWMVPNPLQDIARFISFDDSTGISILAMGSGRIWIADPSTASNLAALDEPLRELDFNHPPHPDSTWPLIHPLPWPSNPENAGQPPLEWDRLPQLSRAVERYFPGKNGIACFGGVTWFLNEALHIPGHATVILFGTPEPENFPDMSVEIIDTGGRTLVVVRHADLEFYEVRLIDQGVSIETVATHIGSGRDLKNLPGSEIPVDGTARNRYATWRRRNGTNGPLCMW